jgi:hypothetical protein
MTVDKFIADNMDKLLKAEPRRYYPDVHFSDLVGKRFDYVGKLVSDKMYWSCYDSLVFLSKTGESFAMYHSQNCCESVYLAEIVGDLQDLVDTEIISATENFVATMIDCIDSRTDAFYHIRTMKGTVTLRWCGESNGYYSETADLHSIGTIDFE